MQVPLSLGLLLSNSKKKKTGKNTFMGNASKESLFDSSKKGSLVQN